MCVHMMVALVWSCLFGVFYFVASALVLSQIFLPCLILNNKTHKFSWLPRLCRATWKAKNLFFSFVLTFVARVCYFSVIVLPHSCIISKFIENHLPWCSVGFSRHYFFLLFFYLIFSPPLSSSSHYANIHPITQSHVKLLCCPQSFFVFPSFSLPIVCRDASWSTEHKFKEKKKIHLSTRGSWAPFDVEYATIIFHHQIKRGDIFVSKSSFFFFL